MTTGRINQVSCLEMQVHQCTAPHNLCCKPPSRQMPLHTVLMSIHITFPWSPFQLSSQCFKVFRLKSTLCLAHYLSTQPHPMSVQHVHQQIHSATGGLQPTQCQNGLPYPWGARPLHNNNSTCWWASGG